MLDITDPVFHDEEKAREFLEIGALASWSRLPVLRRAG